MADRSAQSPGASQDGEEIGAAGFQVAPPDGSPLTAVQNLAICEQLGTDGFYIYYCGHSWNRVTFDHAETIASLKRHPEIEFGVQSLAWHTALPTDGSGFTEFD